MRVEAMLMSIFESAAFCNNRFISNSSMVKQTKIPQSLEFSCSGVSFKSMNWIGR